MEKAVMKNMLRKAKVKDKYTTIRQLCSGMMVLDVGCIGQDVTANSGGWLHDTLRSVAVSVTGVDIAKDKIAAFNARGYTMLHTDQLEKSNEKFNVIVMADVIEHVNDPVGFLRFYSRFLDTQGIIVVTTPNANRAINFLSILIFNNYSVNDEHTCWFCPKTLNEVIMRSDLRIKEFYWLKRYYSCQGLSLISRMITCIADVLAGWRKNYHQNFMVVLSR